MTFWRLRQGTVIRARRLRGCSLLRITSLTCKTSSAEVCTHDALATHGFDLNRPQRSQCFKHSLGVTHSTWAVQSRSHCLNRLASCACQSPHRTIIISEPPRPLAWFHLIHMSSVHHAASVVKPDAQVTDRQLLPLAPSVRPSRPLSPGLSSRTVP